MGGLGDVAASLPRALRRRGCRVTILLPFYGSIETEGLQLERSRLELSVPVDGRERRAQVWRHRFHGIPTYLLASEDYFSGRGVYGDAKGDYGDNALRFTFFSKAALEAVAALALEPDVLHVHDWPAALVPVLQSESDTVHVPTVLTIHNLAHQGVFSRDWLSRLSIPESLFRLDRLEFHGSINFLKGGMMTADALTTVSETYAREIQTDELGAGLDGVARLRGPDLTGIVNGIEPSDWHPGRDPALHASYGPTRLAGKLANKLALQRELGLAVAPRVPLLAYVGRFDPQKGLELLLDAGRLLLAEGAQLVVLGSGSEETLDAFRRMGQSYPSSLAAERGFQEALGRRIYAGADLFLMPSRFEPCGLGQRIALRYGTLPVVRATGGLADTVRDLDDDPKGGNGFVFRDYSVAAFCQALGRALRHYRDDSRWEQWVARAMREDVSFEAPAGRYLGVYERVMKER